MFRNYFTTALRNLVRNRLYAAINIFGLSVGFAAALLIGLFVHDEFSYDRWIPDHERTVLLSMKGEFANFTDYLDMTPPYLKRRFEEEIPEVEKIARMAFSSAGVRHGDAEFRERVHWADSTLFDVLKLPLFAGDPATALQQPDGVVVTRSIARKYFGTDNVLGETLEFDRKAPMRITGVLEDLPSNTHLDLGVIAAGVASTSALTRMEAYNPASGVIPPVVYTYVRLKAGASVAAFERAVDSFAERHPEFQPRDTKLTFDAWPIAGLHFRVLDPKFRLQTMKPLADRNALIGVVLIGGLIVLVAGINFINLTTATATRRAIEIGVRKSAGAQRRHIIWQFISESLFYVAAAAAVALVAAQVLLPRLNAFLDRTMSFGFEPLFMAGVALALAMVGLAAGAYPAFVLSSFRPARVLKGLIQNPARTGLRRLMVTVQFAVLIALVLIVATVYAQLHYAMNEGLRFDKDQILEIRSPCESIFATEIRKLPGVNRVACSGGSILSLARPLKVTAPDGRVVDANMAVIGFDYFDVFGIKPLAGRVFSRDIASDVAPMDRASSGQPSVIINETLARSLGFATPAEAAGQIIKWQRVVSPNGGVLTEDRPSQAIGVVPDFSKRGVRDPNLPTIFWIDPLPALTIQLNVKLDKDRVPETVAAIDALWKRVGEPLPIMRNFLDQAVEAKYRDLTRQMQMLAASAAVAIFLAALGLFGLFGLSALTAEQRTKEIGIRKAMGAGERDVLGLLLWQFTKPVLWANLAAWPAAYVFLKQWLEGFADRIALSPWFFVGASTLAVAIALATVIGHALLVARAQPVAALRYE